MSDLEDIQRKLYKKTPEFTGRPESVFSSPSLSRSDIGWKGSRPQSFFRKNILLFILSFFIIAGGAILLLSGIKGFREENVIFTINAPQEVLNTEIVSWKIKIANKNTIAIENTELSFEYPKHSIPVDEENFVGRASRVTLGSIRGGTDVERVFKARLFGNEDEIVKVKAVLTYKPPGLSISLKKEEFSEVKIISSPVAFTFEGPSQIKGDEEANFTLTFKNFSDLDFLNVRVRINYPKGFSFESANPSPSEDGFWEVPSFKIGDEERVEIKGKFSGAAGEEKIFDAFLEFPIEEESYSLLAKARFAAKLQLAPFALSLKVNGQDSFIAHEGDEITITVEYQNRLSEALKDVTIEGNLVGEAIDVKTVETEGKFDAATGKLQFESNNIPSLRELAAGEGGEAAVSFKIRDKLPITSFSDKNFSIRFHAVIDAQSSSSLTRRGSLETEKEVIIPVATKVGLQFEGVYKGGPFPSEGSAPPRVGSKTAYTIYWRIRNTSNDVRDVEIKTRLPLWASFTGSKQANFFAKGLRYDNEKREIVWEIENLPATTGYVLPVYEARFQVAVVPEDDQVGQNVDIIGATELKGVDAFTNEVVTLSYPSFKTDLDGKLKAGLANVIQ